MNSIQLNECAQKDKILQKYFVGVFAADQLPEKKFPGAYIVNTDNSSGPGQHWVAMFCYDHKIECFDSFGQYPGDCNPHISNWLDPVYQIIHNRQLQSNDTSVCGQYCLFFLLLRAHGYTFEDTLSAFNRKREFNDKFVQKFVNRWFRVSTSLRDKHFFIQQQLHGNL